MKSNLSASLFIALFTIPLIGGCASYKEKFTNKSVVNIGLFADSTITMLSDLKLSLNRDEALLARRFIEPNGPEEDAVREQAELLRNIVANMVRYSIEIVNISELDMTETNRVETFANYLIRFREDMLTMGTIDPLSFDDTIDQIMMEEEFIQAMRKAQPLLNASVMEAALRVDDLIVAVETLSRKVDARIDEEYADIIRYRAKLEREKFNIMTAFEIIYDAYREESPNLDALRKSGVIWTPEIIPAGRPSRDDLAKIAKHLQARMDALQTMQDAMRPNWEDYIATHKELDGVIDHALSNIHNTRILMLTWTRAHQKMSSGTTDPAKWFDIGEVTKSLIKTAPKAIL